MIRLLLKGFHPIVARLARYLGLKDELSFYEEILHILYEASSLLSAPSESLLFRMK